MSHGGMTAWGRGHAVSFYTLDSEGIDAVARFVADGWDRDECVVVVRHRLRTASPSRRSWLRDGPRPRRAGDRRPLPHPRRRGDPGRAGRRRPPGRRPLHATCRRGRHRGLGRGAADPRLRRDGRHCSGSADRSRWPSTSSCCGTSCCASTTSRSSAPTPPGVFDHAELVDVRRVCDLHTDLMPVGGASSTDGARARGRPRLLARLPADGRVGARGPSLRRRRAAGLGPRRAHGRRRAHRLRARDERPDATRPPRSVPSSTGVGAACASASRTRPSPRSSAAPADVDDVSGRGVDIVEALSRAVGLQPRARRQGRVGRAAARPEPVTRRLSRPASGVRRCRPLRGQRACRRAGPGGIRSSVLSCCVRPQRT